jgi:hypothetical protein
MKKATAISQGNNRFRDSPGVSVDTETALELVGIMLLPKSIAGGQDLANNTLSWNHPFFAAGRSLIDETLEGGSVR